MGPSRDHLPDDLESVASRLRANRVEVDPIQLDQIKQRVIARCSTTSPRRATMRSRIATVATLLALVGGTGGALAFADSGNGDGYGQGGAASGQYHHGKHCRRHDHGRWDYMSDSRCPPPEHHHHHGGRRY